MTDSGKYICDAEIKRRTKGTPFKVCGKPATWGRQTRFKFFMHYCEEHKARAVKPGKEHFTPAPNTKAVKLKKKGDYYVLDGNA